MTRNLLALALCGSLALAVPAQAADLGWGGAGGGTSNLYSPTSAYGWSGFYAGINAGYGWGTLSRTPAAGGATVEDNSGGFAIGGHAGYNFDMGGFVLGGEADLQWSNLGHSEDIPGGTLEASLDGFGTLRARAGASVGQVMPYITGGVALGRATVSTEIGGVTTSQSNNHVGWTIGAGLEAAATENLTLRAEYLYVDLGAQTYTTAPGGDIDVAHKFGVVRAGVSYKF